MDWFKSLFSESSDVSMTRFLSFLCVAVGLLIAMYGVWQGKLVADIVGLLLGAGLTAKVTQKFAERTNGKE